MVGTEAKAAAAKYLRERNAAVAKYRGTTRFKEALKIIEKIIELDPQRRQECEREIATTLWAVDVAAIVTEDEWKTVMAHVNADPATMELRRDIEKACWKYLTRIRDLGIGAALRVTLDPVSRDDVLQ